MVLQLLPSIQEGVTPKTSINLRLPTTHDTIIVSWYDGRVVADSNRWSIGK
jgi:hypothetical protein